MDRQETKDPAIMSETEARAEYQRLFKLMGEGKNTSFGRLIELRIEAVRDQLETLSWGKKE